MAAVSLVCGGAPFSTTTRRVGLVIVPLLPIWITVPSGGAVPCSRSCADGRPVGLPLRFRPVRLQHNLTAIGTVLDLGPVSHHLDLALASRGFVHAGAARRRHPNPTFRCE